MLLLPDIKETPIAVPDYSGLLIASGVKDFQEVGGYFVVGPPWRQQPWIIHLSVVLPQLEMLLSTVLPLLSQTNCRFSIPKDDQVAGAIIDGNYSSDSYAKVVSIRALDDHTLEYLVQKLVVITEHFIGPSIHKAFPLGGILYLTYETTVPTQVTNDAQVQDISIPPAIDYNRRLPKALRWPFSTLAPPADRDEPRWISNFLVLHTIKRDFKSRVVLACGFSWTHPFKMALIKVGYAYTVYDHNGRTIADRIKMQYKLLRILSEKGISPKPLGIFMSGDDICLAVEKIRAISFYQIIKAAHGQGAVWLAMPMQEIEVMLNRILRILARAGEMHALGIVHRDLTPANILIDKINESYFIDLEIGYYLQENTPDPVFTLGSPGFMSDEQIGGITPTVKEDIYAIGGTVIMSLTGMWPTTLDRAPVDRQEEILEFFLGDVHLANALLACRHKEPFRRPSIPELQSVLVNYETAIAKLTSEHATHPFNGRSAVWTTALQLLDIITCHVHQQISENLNSTDLSLSCGIVGEIYVLEHAHAHGLYREDFASIRTFYLQQLDERSLARLTRLLNRPTQCWDLLLESLVEQYVGPIVSRQAYPFERANILAQVGPAVAGGLSGIALEILYGIYDQPAHENEKVLSQILDRLLSTQRPDGSWHSAYSDGGKAKFTGIAQGTAGIVLCLLKYFEVTKAGNIEYSIKKGLSWLARRIKADELCIIVGKPGISPWIMEGFTGVALAFLAAADIFPSDNYAETAKGLLSRHPEMMNATSLGFANGIAGIGTAYLGMNHYDDQETWLSRANWLAAIISQLSCNNSDGNTIEWIVDSQSETDMSLQYGNAGILFFLTNYLTSIRN